MPRGAKNGRICWPLVRPLVYAAIKEVVREAEDMKFQDCLNKITQSQFETIEMYFITSEDQLGGAPAPLPKSVIRSGKAS